MRPTYRLLTALTLSAVAAVASPAAEPAKPTVLPVPGGLSQRLATLEAAAKQGKLEPELQKLLDKSRDEAHKFIDDLVDSADFEEWRKAMEESDKSGFARELAGKPSDQVRAALHSRLDRKLGELGKQIRQGLQGSDRIRVEKSFELALKDLSREEAGVMNTAVAISRAENKDAPVKASLDASEAPPQAPYYAVYGYGGMRSYNAQMQGACPQTWGLYERTLREAEQRAWYQQRIASIQWNSRVNGFNQYLYGRSQPWYSNPRYRPWCSTGFPAGMYYQPDRVERIVRRGLWGAAAVAATPFALVASMF